MNADEKRVENLLLEKRFECQPFSKGERRANKTPDFRVFQNHEFVFFCEVKSIDKDRWLDKILDIEPVGTLAGGSRNDPTFNRLTNDIHTAVKQFDAVNPEQNSPNVLALVNHDRHCGFRDLIGVLTGNFIADDETIHPIYWQFSEGRIRDERNRIHVFIWLDDLKRHRMLFSRSHGDHHQKLCRWFGMHPDSLKQIPS